MNTPLTLEQYLLNHKIDFSKDIASPDEIAGDDDLIAKVGSLVTNSRDAITLVIQARIEAIRREMILECSVYDVPLKRMAITELAALFDDFDKYEAALKATEEAKKQRAAEGAGFDNSEPNKETESTLQDASSA